MNRLVIGLGTGRCGTRSLTEMLDNHADITASHEENAMLWSETFDVASKVIDDLLKRPGKPIKADVGYYWLNYTDFLVDKYDAKLICLKRDKDKVVDSFMRGLQNPVYGNLVLDAIREQPIPMKYSEYVTQEDLGKMDASTREFVEHYWDKPLICDTMIRDYFPQYEITDRKSYLSKYWEDYYSEAEKYRDRYVNNFLLIDMDKALNTDEGIKQVFKFIGVAPVAERFHVKTSVNMPLMAVAQ